MSDATFKAYAGAGYTHSQGGGLLQPNDFHGMAALLVNKTPLAANESRDATARQRRALRRLMDRHGHGNWLVARTLTCLERELSGSQPTIDEVDSDVDSEPEDGVTMMRDPYGRAFQGAVESAEEPSLLSNTARMATVEATIGNTQNRQARAFVTQSAESTSVETSPDIAAHTILFPHGAGGYAKTPTGCTRRHYNVVIKCPEKYMLLPLC